MRKQERIPIVLDLIDWKHFITDNTHITADSETLPKLIENIEHNIEHIRKHWLNSPDLRLGQLLINEGFLPNYMMLWLCEENDWLILNEYCKYEDINFWGSNYDKNMVKLPETKYKLLKDLDDAHISAIIDYHTDKGLIDKINDRHKAYFEHRINLIKH